MILLVRIFRVSQSHVDKLKEATVKFRIVATDEIVQLSNVDFLFNQMSMNIYQPISELPVSESEVGNITIRLGRRHQLDEALQMRIAVEGTATPISSRDRNRLGTAAEEEKL